MVDRSSKVDVWSLGCLLLELHTGKAPWEGVEMGNIMFQVCDCVTQLVLLVLSDVVRTSL